MIRTIYGFVRRASASTVWLLLASLMFTGSAGGQSSTVFLTAFNSFDPGGDRLVRFDDGAQTFAVNAGNSPAFLGVTILNDEVLVADFRNDSIQRFSPNGVYLGDFATTTASSFLESDSNGNIYTSRFALGNGAVRFNSAGVVTGTFAPEFQIAGIDADADGNVYAVAGNNLQKYAPSGTFLNSIPAAAGSPRDIAIDEIGRLLYMAHESSGTMGISIYDIAGATPSFIGSISRAPGANLIGIHFAAESGNILATDFGAGSNDPRGLEYSSTGVLLREYRASGADLVLDITSYFVVPPVVPEPGSAVLITMGLVSISCRRRHGGRRG